MECFLTETEKRYYGDLFVCCDEENTGEVPLKKAFELFRSSHIDGDTLTQITDLLEYGNKDVFTRTEFYSYLKMIAAHQANIPLSEEILEDPTLELPLPRFTWLETNPPVHEDDAVDGGESPSSTASDSPTPTNSVQERQWAVGNWSGLCEEQRQLLGTEEESSDRHSSEEDTEVVSSEVWTITPEQRDYYTKQFKQLQPDVRALLAGNIARKFFEKSMLPVQELRKIWQLSDVTKDGMLDLEEFNTAMHLVVLRRNHINVPVVLPLALNPQKKMATAAAVAARPPSPQISETWTKFIDSPTSSPGPKPVNFDFQKASVETDPKILHPKALRLTPEINQLEAVEPPEVKPIQRPQAKKLVTRKGGALPPPPLPLPAAAPSGLCSLSGNSGISGTLGNSGISANSGNSGISGNSGNQMEDSTLPTTKKDKPPPPPPRPIRSHGRSSSLDLNRLNCNKNGFLGAPPLIPPRVSPNISSPNRKLVNQRSEGGDPPPFADFDQFDGETTANMVDVVSPAENYENVDQIRRHGAFEVYRKPLTNTSAAGSRKESSSPPPLLYPVIPVPALPVEDNAKYELYKKLKEQNLVLLRLCQELSQELADVREERTTLRLRLEHQSAT